MGAELARQHARYDEHRFHTFDPLETSFADLYRNELADDNAALIVAEYDGRLAGYVFVRIEPDSFVEWFKAVGWVHDLFVARAFRRSSVGHRLLQAGVDHLRSLGSPGVMLVVAAKNARARRFFKKAGFRVTMHEMRLDFPPTADPTPSDETRRQFDT
jgi:ribosomal protein S18 acetylase RimI-like enzyme